MAASASPALQGAPKPHFHIVGQNCPFCDQEIPPDKLEEISGRIAARERDWLNEATGLLRDQHAHEKVQADQKARAELELVRLDAATALEKLKKDGAARETAIREEEKKRASTALEEKLAESERVRKTAESALHEQLAAAEQAKKSAEQSGEKVKAQLEQAKNEAATAIERLTQDWAVQEATIRADARTAAEASLKEKLAETARVNEAAVTALQERLTASERARGEAIAEVEGRLAEAQRARDTAQQQTTQMRETQETVLNERLQEMREALEKDKTDAVLAAEARAFEERQKWQVKVQELQRQIDNRKPDELGEGAEVKLYEVLKGAFEDDRIRRVEKGTPGADIIHEVVHNGKVCGKIVYDSKNRNAWQDGFVAKLRKDQLAEGADHAILSTNKFPKGARDLHLLDNVIIACPARVLVLAELLRSHIVQTHELRVSNQEREEKTAELYTFITSGRGTQLLESIELLIGKLEQIDVDEEKAHKSVWKKRGELLRSILKVNGDFRFAIDRIIGTAEAAE